MKQTNEERISKLEKEVDELKSIIINLQQQLLQQQSRPELNARTEKILTAHRQITQNKLEKKEQHILQSKKRLDDFSQKIDNNLTKINKVLENKEPIDEEELNQRLEQLHNPLFKYLVKRYLEDKKLGKID